MKVKQRYAGWASWPLDVQEKLQRWNRECLLSFVRGDDFICEGCGREVETHPNGNAVVRAHRKSHGSLRCEDCLTEMARIYHEPPAGLAVFHRDLTGRLHREIKRLHRRIERLQTQIRLEDEYSELLEEHVPDDVLKKLRDELRGRFRRQT